MSDRYCKHIPSGQVFIYQGAYMKRDDFVECDLQGNEVSKEPEQVQVEAAKTAKRNKRAAEVDAVLSEEASKGL